MEEHPGVCLNMQYTQHVSLTQRTDWVTREQRLALTGRTGQDTGRQTAGEAGRGNIPTGPIPAPGTPESRHQGSTAAVRLIPEPSSRWILEPLYRRSPTSPCQKCRSIRAWQNGRECDPCAGSAWGFDCSCSRSRVGRGDCACSVD